MDKDLLIKIILKYGEKQLSKVTEELAELIQAIVKFQYLKSITNKQHIIEEMADVTIMMEQLKIILSITDEILNDEIDIKMLKLEKNI